MYAKGARVVSVFGAFGARALIEMPTSLAEQLFDGPLETSGRHNVIDAIEHDIAQLSELGRASALAATAVQLGYELSNPYNSATSKSMCAKSLMDALDRLRALSPARQEEDDVTDLNAERNARRAGIAAAPNP